jgi:uncharacterized protein (TIGR04255 family)
MADLYDPLTAQAPAEVPLTDAPLARVIAQVRFPKQLSIESRDAVAAFQRSVGEAYPVLREEASQGVLLGKGGAQTTKPETAWRFADVAQEWKLSLAPDFLSLDTTRYLSRSDFLARLRSALDALESHVGPKLVDRFGLRYIDRITGDALSDITRMVRPELCGLIGTASGAHATHALTETMFTLDTGQLRARWALLPQDATHDPASLEPLPEVSWVLDLDMFRTGPRPFSVDNVMEDAERFAERIYTFFRWAVTDDFLRRYGGTP